jgi:major membrane immunogen (membrane-anchored lipoprotein)
VTDRKRTAHISEVLRGESEDQPEDGPPPSEYLDQYSGRNVTAAGTFAIQADGGDIEAVSGATISSRAVADAVNGIADAFRENQAKLQAAGR